ncbi:DUF4132 domain-containing protein [Dactylosporangium sp. CA-139066]|uniref:DUF4132 domain-containing protein n=1 Tax=Dactylosporangium sp. CA-139066 TaxID=3239930 RepID=UPI003D91719E
MNEQRFVLPDSWRRSIHPRRGGTPVGYAPVGAPPPDPAPARGPLMHPGTPRDLAEAGLAALDATAEPTPLGVAAMWAALGSRIRYGTDDLASVADLWIARHGPAFAARVAAEFAALDVVTLPWQPTEPGRLALARAAERDQDRSHDLAARLLAPVRAALAAAPDEVYAEAVEGLREARAGSAYTRIAASFLAPSETHWVDEDSAALPSGLTHAALLMASVSTVEPAVRIAPRLDRAGWAHLHEPAMLHTLTEALGDGILDVFGEDWAGRTCYDGGYSIVQFWRDMGEALSVLPTDRAFQALLDQAGRQGVPAAIVAAAGRFPARAMRLMDASAGRPRVGELLRRHAARFPELAPQRLRFSPGPRPGEAPADALPAVLASPPWIDRPKPARPVVLADLRCTDPPSIAWRPGERESLAERLHDRPADWRDYPGYAERLRAGTAEAWEMRWLMSEGPPGVARSALLDYRPAAAWNDVFGLTIAAVRFGVDVFPPLVDALRARPADGELAMPFVSPEIALLMADWHARLKSARRTATAWFRAHPAAAARALVPAALGKAGPQRRAAEQALVMLAGAGQRDTVTQAAEGYGPAAAKAIGDLLDADPLVRHLPARIPLPPEWADPAALPPVRLRDGAGTLPASAVRHLLTMLMMSRPGEPYAGLELVRATCEPHDLARLGWELLQRWDEADAPLTGGWALDAQAVFGDDETAAGIARAVQRWSQEDGHKRAAAGLDALAALGTDAALRELRDISTRVRSTAVRTRAERHLAVVAEGLGLSPDQLADRLVPHFDLAADATMRLDFGPRRFVAGFDEQLRPYVADEDGTPRKDLPEPGARDDERLATAARRRFTEAKKGARKIASEQARRLEQAMIVGRQWTAAEFRTVFLEHPLMWLLARRLVWTTTATPGATTTATPGATTTATPGATTPGGTTPGGTTAATPAGSAPAAPGGTTAATPGGSAGDTLGRGAGDTPGWGGAGTALRIAEDRSLADVADRTVHLPDDALLRVAHPVELDVPAWTQVFDHYGLLQPFRQLGRRVEHLRDEERPALRLTRFDGRKAMSVKVIGLERRGWRRDGRRGGHLGWIERYLPGGARVVVFLEPGILLGVPDHHPEQAFSDVWICPAGSEPWVEQRTVPFGELDPASASELLCDLGSCV